MSRVFALFRRRQRTASGRNGKGWQAAFCFSGRYTVEQYWIGPMSSCREENYRGRAAPLVAGDTVPRIRKGARSPFVLIANDAPAATVRIAHAKFLSRWPRPCGRPALEELARLDSRRHAAGFLYRYGPRVCPILGHPWAWRSTSISSLFAVQYAEASKTRSRYGEGPQWRSGHRQRAEASGPLRPSRPHRDGNGYNPKIGKKKAIG